MLLSFVRGVNCKVFNLVLIYVVLCIYIFLEWKFSEVEGDIRIMAAGHN